MHRTMLNPFFDMSVIRPKEPPANQRLSFGMQEEIIARAEAKRQRKAARRRAHGALMGGEK